MGTRTEWDAGWLCEAACTYTPLPDHRVDALADALPGVQVLGLALAASHDIVQISFRLHSPREGPCLGKTQVFPGSGITLAGAVVQRGAGFTGSLRKMPAFPDAAVHCADGYVGGSLTCVPLRSARSGRPFGALSASFAGAGDAAPCRPAVQALAAAISCAACEKQLREFAAVVVDVVSFMPKAPLEEEEEVVVVEDDDCASSPSSDCCGGDGDAPELQPHPLWLTFPDAAAEAAFVRWQARHLRFLDPAGALTFFSLFFYIGFAPRYAGWERHPWALAAGWLGLTPVLASATPWTSAFFIAHREALVTAFQAASLCWHLATANATTLTPPQLYTWWDPLAGCYLWMGLNLFMFQLRWWKAACLGAAMLALDAVPMAPRLCAALGVGPDACLARTLATAGSMVSGVLLLLRFSEKRMRRMFAATAAHRRA